MKAASILTLSLLSVGFLIQPATAAPPVVSSVVGVQREGTKLVDITYNVADPDSSALTVTLQISSDAGASWTVPVTSATGQIGAGITPGTARAIVWNAGTDWSNQTTTTMRYRISAEDGTLGPPPDGFVTIPAGSFQMGDVSYNGGVHSVTLSAFYMQATEVSNAIWDSTYTYAIANGYAFENAGAGKAATHPVHSVSWYDVVKWCNARSQQEGLVPCYYSGAVIYKTGEDSATRCDFTRNGYRLPTEAEWEKAARGGLSWKRFPWGDTITHSQANYYSSESYSYDVSATREWHPTYWTSTPFTSPVGSFAANGYGLYDMSGNIGEWCWDWWPSDSYPSEPVIDPTGPATGTHRVMRGGSWSYYAVGAQVYYQSIGTPSLHSGSYVLSVGFRLARGH